MEILKTDELEKKGLNLYIHRKFEVAKKEVERLIPGYLENFSRWNRVVSFGLNTFSYPYRNQQEVVIFLANQTLANKTQEEITILDDGCGEGRVIEEITAANKIKTVTALDPDEKILNKISFKCHSPNLYLIVSFSFISLPLLSESVDLIISNLGGVTYGSLFFEKANIYKKREALEKVLKERKRILKKGGYLIIGSLVPQPDFLRIKKETIAHLLKTFNLKGFWYIFRNRKSMMEASWFMTKYAEEGWAHYLSTDEWKEILEKEGFLIEEIKTGHYSGQGIVLLVKKL